MKGRRCPECRSFSTKYGKKTPLELVQYEIEDEPEKFPKDFDPRTDTCWGVWTCKNCRTMFTDLAPLYHSRLDAYRIRKKREGTSQKT